MKTFINGYRLEVPHWWDKYDNATRALWMNGCGLASWPIHLRNAIDKLSGFNAASKPHDVEWSAADSDFAHGLIDIEEYASRLAYSNFRFKRNCKAIIKQDGIRPWNHPLKWIRRRWLARAFWRAVLVGAMGAVRKRKG